MWMDGIYGRLTRRNSPAPMAAKEVAPEEETHLKFRLKVECKRREGVAESASPDEKVRSHSPAPPGGECVGCSVPASDPA